MNSLSKFLYFADIVGQITITLFFVGLALTAIGVAFFILDRYSAKSAKTYGQMVTYVKTQCPHSWESDKRQELLASLLNYEENAPKGEEHTYKSRSWLIWGVILVVFSSLLPSKEAVYLIAGSEAGEAVVTSDTGQEILDDIQQVIKHQLQQLKGF